MSPFKNRKTVLTIRAACFMILSFLFFINGKANAEEISILAENAFTPFSEENGQGLSNEIVKASFQAVGVNVKLEIYPFTRLMAMVKNGEAIGGFNAVPTSETLPDYIFGKQSIYVTHMYFYYHKDDPLIIDGKEEVISKITQKNVEVGEVLGYIYPPFYEGLKTEKDPSKRLKFNSVDADDLLIKQLNLKRIKVALMTAEVANYHIQKMGLQSVIRHGNYAWDAPLYIAFSKVHPKGKYYAEMFDKGMETIKSNGTYAKILQKYSFLQSN